jgi:nitroimidazol reductase NimA-like FMN-containing flavoprotein (pyridoxamine 5'-phosphate oxidase superfamily)
MPMNHFYSDDGCIYFHCGRVGHRLDALKKHDKVSFCVYDSGHKENGEWALNIKSVIVFGRIDIIDDYDTVVNVSRQLCYKFTQDEAYIEKEIKSSGKGTLILKLTPEHICGKSVKEA